MRAEQLAIKSVSTSQESFEEALAAYASAGFRNVELDLQLVKDWLGQGHTVKEARQRLARHGLRAIGGDEDPVQCFVPPQERRADHQIHLGNARLVHDLGGGVLGVGTDGPSEPSIRALDTVAEALRGLAESTEDLDVVIALEFNWSPLVKSLQSAVRVAEKVRHPRVGVLFDPAHYYTTPTKLEHLNADTVRWIKHVHLDDMPDEPGDLAHRDFDRVLPGYGTLDLRTIIATLEQNGYDGFFSIELFNEELWQIPAGKAARRCYESLLPLCS
jgi:2-keto-myo-inositol isomerase